MTEQERLYRAHCIRWAAHWGKNYDIAKQPWPQTRAEWEQTGHGAPWDSNVEMAKWQLKVAQQMLDAELIGGK